MRRIFSWLLRSASQAEPLLLAPLAWDWLTRDELRSGMRGVVAGGAAALAPPAV